MTGNEAEVGRCEACDCSLWEFRFGKNPTPEMAAEARPIRVLGRDKELWEPKPKMIGRLKSSYKKCDLM
jgi:hypothetical protein